VCPLRAATRGSTLARRQTDLVAALLGVEVLPVVVETAGDRRTDAQIWELGGQGAFVKEVQAAVLDGRADFAVHSAKDLPTSGPDGLVIAAVPPRADARDALVGRRLDAIPPGGRVATGSVRRRAQLTWLRPDLTFSGLRGNIETRLGKAPNFDAIVVAAAALARLDRSSAAAQVLDPDLVLPQVGQGALAVECRADAPAEVRERLAAVDDPPSRRAVEAERAFLAAVGGGCDLPVAAYAVEQPGGTLHLTGLIATLDGSVVLRHGVVGGEPGALGRAVAGHLLVAAGGRALLDALRPAAAATGGRG
jgi:hydroxymethylbilane synthase